MAAQHIADHEAITTLIEQHHLQKFGNVVLAGIQNERDV